MLQSLADEVSPFVLRLIQIAALSGELYRAFAEELENSPSLPSPGGNLDGAVVADALSASGSHCSANFLGEARFISASRWKKLAALREAKRGTDFSLLVFRHGRTDQHATIGAAARKGA